MFANWINTIVDRMVIGVGVLIRYLYFRKMYRPSCSHLVTATAIPFSIVHSIRSNEHKPVCADCGHHGPNLWICLYKDCFRIGCSEKLNDHSTLHNTTQPAHCIHMNLSTERIWCYECRSEVFVERPPPPPPTTDSDQEADVSPPSSGHGSINTLRSTTPERQPFAFERGVDGVNVVGMGGDGSDGSDVDESVDYGVDTSTAGLVGLQNIGNTCYMNAALQALSNTVPLTRFFLECAMTVQVLSEGRKPGLSRTYQTLMHDMWLKKKGGYVTPSGILYGIRSVYAMFRGYHQHDTQEFLRNFMDQLHEELKQPCPPEHQSGPDAGVDTFSLAMDEPLTLSSSYDSSEGEYETCDSGVSERSSLSDETERPNAKRRHSRSTSPGRRLRTKFQNVVDMQPTKKSLKYRSIISDVFDGKLLSSVQCLTCDRVSSRVETFQDLSLPIPSKDHLMLLHGRSAGAPGGSGGGGGGMTTCSEAVMPVQDGWISWILAWLKSWFYGPVVTLHDCLAAFFSTDELKGDNMYSCEKCNKLRNGIKFSKVLQLPEVLCIHLKRFRHELMFSSKISSVVSFPLKGLDMRPYLHTECVSKYSTYELFSVICHHGTAGGGHYICYALNGGEWYEFDDQCVTRVPPEKVQSCEAYVLFYRKTLINNDEMRDMTARLSKLCSETITNEVAYVSRQWLSRFRTCAEPGTIDNSDFLCHHGFVHPDRAYVFDQITFPLSLNVYEYLQKKYGGCPPITNVHTCPACQALNKRLLFEMESFVQITRDAHCKDSPMTHYMSTSWYTQWHNFVHKRSSEPPGPIDNSKIDPNNLDVNEAAQVPEETWSFFFNIYGGGPELRIKRPDNEEVVSSESSEEDNKNVALYDFVIPTRKKAVTRKKSDGIDKSMYCAGEPIEAPKVEEKNDTEVRCNGHADDVVTDGDTKVLVNGVGGSEEATCNDTKSLNGLKLSDGATEDDENDTEDGRSVETQNGRRHRRRKRALSSI